MTAVFVDTSFYVAAVSPRDVLHRAAAETSRQLRAKRFTTEYVLIELGNWLARTGSGRGRTVLGVRC